MDERYNAKLEKASEILYNKCGKNLDEQVFKLGRSISETFWSRCTIRFLAI